jgi:hypothetical protein
MRLAVRVQPGARRSAVVGRLASGEWKVAVSAPAEGGRANAAVTELLADALGLKRRQVSVTRGHASRSKQIEIAGLEPADIERRLRATLDGTDGDDGQ